MILFPAVDLKGGKAVRLRRGKADDSTIFADIPLDAALHWEQEGASWLHLIDLDAAFDGHSPHKDIVRTICHTLKIPVQLGGGIRDERTAAEWLDAGVKRIIIGTLALENPALFAKLCKKYPKQIGVSLDAVNGQLKTHGWVDDSSTTVDDILPRLSDDGVAFIIYTDIERDGMCSGVNLPALEHLCENSRGIPVIAAGGVATLEDIRNLYPLSRSGKLEGVITGRAIYEGSLNFSEALAWIQKQKVLD